MSVESSVVRTMVPGEVDRKLENFVIVRKQLCIIGHSYIRRLKEFVDSSPVFDRDFGLNTVMATWLGLIGINLESLRETGLAFILDYCPDIILLQAINNDMNSSGAIDQVVAAHVDFVTGVSSQICGPLHRRTPRFLSMEAYNDNVDECNSILR